MRIVDFLSSRRGFALAIVLVVAVSAYLRGVVVSEALAEPAGFTLCHGAASGTSSGDAVNHSCCDDCVLAAAVITPEPPTLAEPLAVVFRVPHVAAAVLPPVAGKVWTPRQSQGPPRA